MKQQEQLQQERDSEPEVRGGQENGAFEYNLDETLAENLVNKELERQLEEAKNIAKQRNKTEKKMNQLSMDQAGSRESTSSSSSKQEVKKERSGSVASSSADSLGNSTTYTATTSTVGNGSQQGDSNNKTSAGSKQSNTSSSNNRRRTNPNNNNFIIEWQNLDYVVTSSWWELTKQRKPILNGLSGQFKSGELSAVLGPSGAGKSTFIDCLLAKRERGLSGTTRVRFENKSDEVERRRRKPLRIATIPQEDHLMDTLTVMETFMFASKIKNAHLKYEDEAEELWTADSMESSMENSAQIKPNRPEKQRKPLDHFANVQRVIQQLNLSSCSGNRCGSLSGGQYKRVSIGQELLSRPDLMILDEPTSGLDSVTCFQTINALRQLIETSPYPMAIVATIHQPDIEVFELFHKCYVLASGGRAIYEGPTNAIVDTVKLSLKEVEERRAGRAKFEEKFKSGLEIGGSLSKNALEVLKCKLEPDSEQYNRLNPARLIVELAANEYGYEITNAMNELQNRDSQHRELLMEKANAGVANDSSEPTTPASSSSSIINLPLTQAIMAPILPHHLTGSNSSKVNNNNSITFENGQISAVKFDYELNDPSSRKPDLDKLLCLVSANVNQRRSIGVHFKHLYLHTKRSWLTILRDPMLFSLQVLLHILVPLLISYSFQGQRGDACPKVGPLDVIEEAYRKDGGNILDDLQRELRIVFENLGYMFFQIYVIIFAAVCVTSLTYPLIMHVLLKEYRNGWYSLSSYFIGRTLADLPVPTFNVFIAMAISYHLTGQPLSPYGWRFLCVAGVTILATLVAQTQGLMFGALLMNMAQSAVFVAPASTAPLVVVSGFLIRIANLPWPLQILSNFSYFTHLLNGFIVSRYGFNRCPCKDEDFIPELTHRVPEQARTLMNIWVDTFADDYRGPSNSSNTQIDLVGNLVETISRAKTFGFELSNCQQVKPFTMLDFQLQDRDLYTSFIILIGMLVVFRWLTYLTLSWKINSSI